MQAAILLVCVITKTKLKYVPITSVCQNLLNCIPVYVQQWNCINISALKFHMCACFMCAWILLAPSPASADEAVVYPLCSYNMGKHCCAVANNSAPQSRSCMLTSWLGWCLLVPSLPLKWKKALLSDKAW